MYSVHSRHEVKTEEEVIQGKEKLVEYVRNNIIGKNVKIRTPYGMKPLTYWDYTASGRSLEFIENYIRDQILPVYANTHTLNSRTAKQTIYSRNEARDIIKRWVNGNEKDAVIFVGTGSTAAVNHIVKSIDTSYRKGEDLSSNWWNFEENFCQVNRWKTFDCTLWLMSFANQGQYEAHENSSIHSGNYEKYKLKKEECVHTEPPVVFASVMEHNSNLLPWRESGAIVEFINIVSETGELDYEELKELLSKYRKYNGLKIGSFSAGSNITGVLNDVDYISYLLHSNNALCLIDYAATAPYVDININGWTKLFNRVSIENEHLCYKDAIFISPHKFIGGPDTPGLLVCKKSLLCNNKPIQVGGGIVFFVDKESHVYIRGVEEREEGGTPSIIGVVRAGLTFQLKEALTPSYLESKCSEIVKYANERFSQMKNVFLIGNNSLQKVPIYAFMIKWKGKFLHFHFAGKLLNDLFGIQTRTGCSWAAVYGQQLLGINLELAREYKKALWSGHEMVRMGYVRMNFSWFMDQEEIDYILDAIEFVSKYGWMFLPDYTFNKDLAEFYCRIDTDHQERNWIGEISYSEGFMNFTNSNAFVNNKDEKFNYPQIFKDAKDILVSSIKNYHHIYGKSKLDQKEIIDEKFRHLVFYIYPSEVLDELDNIYNSNKDLAFDDLIEYTKIFDEFIDMPFIPLDYTKKSCESKISEETKELFHKDDPIKNKVSNDFEFDDDCLPGFGYADFQDEEKEEILPIIEPPKDILKFVGEAIKDFNMINQDDGVLVALSGGKDSLSLLNILRYLQRKAPVKFKLGAVTIDPKTVEYDPSPLKAYLRKLGIPYFYEVDNLIERAEKSMENNSICSFWSRMKRGMIYSCARREGYNVIAMGQHLDDLAESFIMSAFNNGTLRTMKANYVIDKGDLRVIRPLVYCREKLFKSFSESWNLPVITENWPAWFSEPKERHRVKLLLSQQEHEIPTLFSSLLNCMKPLMQMNLKDIMKKKTWESEEKEPEPNFCG